MTTSAFSPSQISAYLDFVSFPPHLRTATQPRNHELLQALHVHQITTFPYENLSLHYDRSHANDLDPQALYRKFLGTDLGRGRGGYCMETCVFMREILRGMGFRSFVAGAKIRLRDPDGVPGGKFVSWVHCVNVVTLGDGSRWHVDVGFGGDGATKPLPVGPEGTAVANLGTQQVRIARDVLPEASPEERHFWWIYQYRNEETRPWLSYYAFPELEFTQVDLEHQNYWISTNSKSPQTQRVLATKFLRGEDGDGRPVVVGKRTLFAGTVKENLGEKTRVVRECRTEDERVEALRELFGIELWDEQREAIKGWRTELVTSDEVAVA